MKRSLALVLAASIAACGSLYAATNPVYSMETVTIDSFDAGTVYEDDNAAVVWQAQASKNTMEGFPRTVMANAWPRDKYGESPANAGSLMSVGVNASFKERGNDYVDIVPGIGAAGGDWQPKPIPIEGKVSAIAVWAWGSNYNYTLSVVIEDGEGLQFRLDMGSLKFMGWRNLIVDIPGYVSQRRDQYPFRPGVKLVKFVVNCNPKEKSDNFYIYLDNATAFTATQRYRAFDGNNLVEPTVVSNIWGAPAANPTAPARTNPNPTAAAASGPAPTIPGTITSDNKLQEISIDRFEDASFWQIQMARNDGFAVVRPLNGAPADVRPVNGGTNGAPAQAAPAAGQQGEASPAGDKVLGARVQFVRRAMSSFTLIAARPIPVEGVTKVVSLWVAGRNVPHTLSLIIRDVNGNDRTIKMGSLNFSGWRQMSAAIPSTISQQDFHYGEKVGISVVGFKVDFNLDDTYGAYYMYLDDLRVQTDLYAMGTGKAADDPKDVW